MITIAELVLYPIKSLRGVSVPRWPIEPRGLRYDRRWMLVDGEGQFLTQRNLHELALFDVAISVGELIVARPGFGDCAVPFEPRGESKRVTVWNDQVNAIEADPKASEWFSRVLGTPCTLVHMPESSDRRLFSRDQTAEGPVSFADTNPVLVAGTASIADLNGRLPAPIPIRRFRPNVILDGGGAFEEDEWIRIEIGGVTLHRSMRCARCLVTTIDIDTAKPSDEPLRTLSTFRKEGSHVWFGTYYAPQNGGEIFVGQSVTAT